MLRTVDNNMRSAAQTDDLYVVYQSDRGNRSVRAISIRVEMSAFEKRLPSLGQDVICKVVDPRTWGSLRGQYWYSRPRASCAT
jgi:hypothetical protein